MTKAEDLVDQIFDSFTVECTLQPDGKYNCVVGKVSGEFTPIEGVDQVDTARADLRQSIIGPESVVLDFDPASPTNCRVSPGVGGKHAIICERVFGAFRASQPIYSSPDYSGEGPRGVRFMAGNVTIEALAAMNNPELQVLVNRMKADLGTKVSDIELNFLNGYINGIAKVISAGPPGELPEETLKERLVIEALFWESSSERSTFSENWLEKFGKGVAEKVARARAIRQAAKVAPAPVAV